MAALLMRICCCCCVGSHDAHDGLSSSDGADDPRRRPRPHASAGAYSPVGVDALSPDRMDMRDEGQNRRNGIDDTDQFEIEIDEQEEDGEEEHALASDAGRSNKQQQQQHKKQQQSMQQAEKEEREDDDEDNASAPLQPALEMQPLAAAGRSTPGKPAATASLSHTGNGLTPQRRPPITILARPPLVYSFPAPPSAAPSAASVLSTPASASAATSAHGASRSPDSLVTSSDLERDDTDYDIQRFRQALEEAEGKATLEQSAPVVAAASLVPPPARPPPVLLPRSKLVAAAARGIGSASARASNEGPLTFLPANGPPHLSSALPTVRKGSSTAARSVPSSPAVDVSNLLMRSQLSQQQHAGSNGIAEHKSALQPSSIQLQQQPHHLEVHAPPHALSAQHVLHMVHSPSAPALSALVSAIPDAAVEPASPRTTAQLERLAEEGDALAAAAAAKEAAEAEAMIPEEEAVLEATSPAHIPTVEADLHPRPIVSPTRSRAPSAAAAAAAAAAIPVPAAAEAAAVVSTTVPASAVASTVSPVKPAATVAASAAPAVSAPPSKTVAASASAAAAPAAAPTSAASKKHAHAHHAHSNPLDRLGVPGGVISSAHMEELMSALKGSPSACADDGALINVDDVSYAHLFAFLAGTPRTLPGKVVRPFVIPELQALIAAPEHAAGARHGHGHGHGHGQGRANGTGHGALHGPPQLKRSASVSTAHSAPHPPHAGASGGSSHAVAPVPPKVGSALSLEAAKLLLSFMHWLVDIRIDRPIVSSSASAAAAAALSTLTFRFDFGAAASGGSYAYIDLPSQPTWVLGSKHPRDPYLVHPLNQPKIYTNESHRLCIHRELRLQFSSGRGIVSIRSGDVSIKKSFVSLNADLRTEYRPGMVEYDDARNPFLVMRDDDQSQPKVTDDGHYLPRTFDTWLVVTVLTRETWVGLPIIGKQAPPNRKMKPHEGYPYP